MIVLHAQHLIDGEKLLDSFATCETAITKCLFSCRFFSFSFGYQNQQWLTHCKRKETQLSQTDTQRQDARQDERQLPFAVTLAGRSDWHAACDNDATLCACALRVAASHVARLTELYGNIRSSAPIFRISDFKDFKISP